MSSMYKVPSLRANSPLAAGSAGQIERLINAIFTAKPASVSNTCGWRVVRDSSDNAASYTSKSQLRSEKYAELWSALALMAKADPESPEFIDDDTYFDASNFLALLASYEVSPPKVFSHGGDAATFTWDAPSARRRYLTPCDGDIAFHETGRAASSDIDAIYQIKNVHSLNSLMRILGGNV